jgi:hypothetical protein
VAYVSSDLTLTGLVDRDVTLEVALEVALDVALEVVLLYPGSPKSIIILYVYICTLSISRKVIEISINFSPL